MQRSRSIPALVLGALIAAAAPAAGQAGAARTVAAGPAAYGAAFSIEYAQGYKVLSVERPWPGATKGFRYVLYERGTPKPRGIEADRFVETPVRRVISFSTTYLPQIALLGEADSVVGVDVAAYVNTPEIRARIEAGKTVEVARDWAPNVEIILAQRPDAIFSYGMGNEWDSHPKLVELGLPVIINGEWNETDPLARTEWLVFLAAFYGKEARAQAYVDEMAARYRALEAKAAGAAERPAVLVNGPFQGTWSVSGGKSFMARFIADAGGAYLWADDPGTGGLTLSVEAVYARAMKAELWLNPNLTAAKLGDLAALDPRFMSLPVVARGGVWNNNRRLGAGGGNDYFESAVLNPDLVLGDLIQIFHPGLLGDRELRYYRKLER